MKLPIMVKKEADLFVCDITLLSEDEYERLRENIPNNGTNWWLRSKTKHNCCACVDKQGNVVSRTVSDLNFVRPAVNIIGLHKTGLNAKIGDEVCLFGHRWTIISMSPTYALCNDGLFFRSFNQESIKDGANEYARSRIRECIENWFEEQMIPILLENKPEHCDECPLAQDEGCPAGGEYRFWDESGSDCEYSRHTDCPLDALTKENRE